MFETGDIIKRYKKPSVRSADYYIVMGKSHSSRSKTAVYVVGFYNDKTVSTGWVLPEIYFDNFRVVGHVDITAQIDKEIKLITKLKPKERKDGKDTTNKRTLVESSR